MIDSERVVVIEGLRKRYPGVNALAGIDLTLSRGEIWGLLGPDGSGKSTLLKCLVGLVRPDAGRIEICQEPFSRRAKANIAFVPEVDNLYRWMTVQETMDFIAAFYDDWQPQRAKELLDFMRLDPKSKVSTLSKGMKARFKLTLALARKAPLVLLDEPLSG